MAISGANGLAQLKDLSRELRELDVGQQVPVLHSPICPLELCREFVAANKPCLIKGAINHWPAITRWSTDYFTQRWGDKAVTVDVTPNGRGDAVTILHTADGSSRECFAIPHERSMTVAEFMQLIHHTRQTGAPEVPYIQHQNNNLLEEWEELLEDVEPHLRWADAAFGSRPDAVNLWIGDDRSATSFHKDHYENMYAVVSGCKIFTLLPPSDIYRMHLGRYPAAVFAPAEDGRLAPVLKEPEEWVFWCPVEPYPTGDNVEVGRRDWPLYFDPSLPAPLQVEVHAGDLLYLPSMWYHFVQQQVGQDELVIAVNYWYDMKFDLKYAYFRHVESVACRLGLAPAALQSGEAGDDEQVGAD